MLTDTELRDNILAELKWRPNLNAAHIGVTVKDGVVTLVGPMTSYGEKHAVEKAVKTIYGVRAIADELFVRLPETSRRSDEELAAACLRAWKVHSEVPDHLLTVTVEGGRVTLEGAVDWQYQRKAAEQAVRHLTGVVSLGNRITVRPRPSRGDVKDEIESALRRSAEIDARRIDVAVRDRTVTLHGWVRSWAERELAARTAWRAPGVVHVENMLDVAP